MRANFTDCRRGFTLLEVLIALFILALAVTADFGLLISADKAAALGKSVACAGIMAANEAERIKCAISSADTLGDTTYTDSIEGMTFEVRRTVAAKPSAEMRGTGVQELEIAIVKKPGEKVLAQYRVLQGRTGP